MNAKLAKALRRAIRLQELNDLAYRTVAKEINLRNAKGRENARMQLDLIQALTDEDRAAREKEMQA